MTSVSILMRNLRKKLSEQVSDWRWLCVQPSLYRMTYTMTEEKKKARIEDDRKEYLINYGVVFDSNIKPGVVSNFFLRFRTRLPFFQESSLNQAYLQ